MPLDPRDVFADFSRFVDRFRVARDADVEDQLFDRKDVPKPAAGNVSKSTMDDLREAIRETVSAFANTNLQGGLLVLGISKTGTVSGVDHLTEEQRNSLTNIGHLLQHQAARCHLADVYDGTCERKVLLIFAPETRDAICETVGSNPRAWKRSGMQNLPLTDRDREQLLRDKGVRQFETRAACAYDPSHVDTGLLAEIRRTWPELDNVGRSDADLLHELGALERGVNNSLSFTNAGALFFMRNPQRVLAQAAVRFLRFEADSSDPNPGVPSLDRPFSGNVTEQLRQIREFLRESGLIRVYAVRRQEGGFEEQPELPPIVIDEAIVNAVAHRDYALEWQIEVRMFRDAVVIQNPGRLLQRSGQVPATFRLDERSLSSTPRNPILLGWLRRMRDQKGQHFVRALSEGTKTMLREMQNHQLPAPSYRVNDTETILVLNTDPSRFVRTEQRATEFTNLFPLIVKGALPVDWRVRLIGTLRDALAADGWFIDRYFKGRVTAHVRGQEHPLPADVRRVVRLYPAYLFAFRQFHERVYLIIDYSVEVRNVLTLAELSKRGFAQTWGDRWGTAHIDNTWREVRIENVTATTVDVSVPDVERRITLRLDDVIPKLGMSEVDSALLKAGLKFDLHTEVKKRSLASVAAASRLRAEQTIATARLLAERVLPLRVAGVDVTIATDPLRLGAGASSLPTRALAEPLVEFGRHRETSNIREGITEFGAYGAPSAQLELIPIVEERHRAGMAALIDRLKAGKYKYKGAERTFGTRFTYSSIATFRDQHELRATCERILGEHPAWSGNPALDRIFLVHTAEAGFSTDDEQAPYYQVKRLLLERGVPCQMLDTPILLNPDWKDLNLALNIVAKCGGVPWVLPEGLPDADFFVGLSYTQHRGSASARLMGYANVFNSYGRWLFYSGNAQTFSYDQRTTRMVQLVDATLRRMELSETPHVHFHYSAKFSREDRDAIVAAARRVRPKGTYSFIWINAHHPVRLYDERPESDGSLSRGTYVVTGTRQLYLSTTGYNPYRKSLGTPVPLEVNVWRYAPLGHADTTPDLHGLARQILALTKLNWSSSDALVGEPITTKYAGEIAYLTAAFIRQGAPFKLHEVLEQTAWFL